MTSEQLDVLLQGDIEAIARQISAEATALDGDPAIDDSEGLEVRLQVSAEGSWTLRTGDPQYDTDHRGYWGANVAPIPCTLAEARDIAVELVSEAVDDYAQAYDGSVR